MGHSEKISSDNSFDSSLGGRLLARHHHLARIFFIAVKDRRDGDANGGAGGTC